MVKKTNFLIAIYFLFMLLLIASGSTVGAVGDLLYYLAFFLPICLGLIAVWRSESPRRLDIVNKRLPDSLPFIIPSVHLILTGSAIATLLLGALTGKSPSADIPDNLLLAIGYHALLPAVLEELLFRYIPLRLLGESKRCAVIVSSVSFALVHHSFFSFGYAALAGVFLALIALATESILPSVILHFINNVLSVLLMLYSDEPVFLTVFTVIFLILYIVSAVIIYVNRERYLRAVSDTFTGDAPRFSAVFLLFLVVSAALGVLELL